MSHARVTLDRNFVVAPVPRRLFGSFVEHMGRCVYTGVFEPGHPLADERGFRSDVLELTRELGATVVRYPGGNFVSGYRWEDGVGPVVDRPRRLDGAWHSIETNAFGLHEFVEWARTAGVEVMEAVNLGTRGVQDARELVEYANHPGGTALSDLRRTNGHADPFDIRVWCLGNEMDGPWQIGHKTADEYGRLAAETAKAMRLVDPTIELVTCGSSGYGMSTFGDWEHTVLRHCYEHVDYVSLHAYYQEHDGDRASFLASGVEMDRHIEAVIATVDAVKEAGKHRRDVHLAFDEWNVWYMNGKETPDQPGAIVEEGAWREHPPVIEDEYSVVDAVVVGSLLNSLLRHGDRVKIANQAQLVNVIAPIRTEQGGAAWRQTIFWPFSRTATLARGEVLRSVVASPQIDTARYGEVDQVDVAATWEPGGTGPDGSGRLALFLVNRGLDTPVTVDIDLHGWRDPLVRGAEVLTSPENGSPESTNSRTAPDAVGLVPLDAAVHDGAVHLTLPPLAWAVVEVAASPA